MSVLLSIFPLSCLCILCCCCWCVILWCVALYCCVLFSVLFLYFEFCLSYSYVIYLHFCSVVSILCVDLPCFALACVAVWCRGQWSVAQYARGAASACKGAEGADSNSGSGEGDTGEEMFTTESAHRASPAGALPLSHRERKLHRCCYTSHCAHCGPSIFKGIVLQKMLLLSSFTYPLVAPNLCYLLSSVEQEVTFFQNILATFQYNVLKWMKTGTRSLWDPTQAESNKWCIGSIYAGMWRVKNSICTLTCGLLRTGAGQNINVVGFCMISEDFGYKNLMDHFNDSFMKFIQWFCVLFKAWKFQPPFIVQ